MKSRIRVSPQADRDLDAAADYYIEQENLALAQKFLSCVDRSLALLEGQPNMGSTRLPERPKLVGVRWVPVARPFQKHLIIYRYAENVVIVLRVLHANQNILAILD